MAAELQTPLLNTATSQSTRSRITSRHKRSRFLVPAWLLRWQAPRRQLVRRFVHFFGVPVLFLWELWDVPNPYLGTFLPVVFYSAIGWAVPWEFFSICSATLACLGMVDSVTTYSILLIMATIMTSVAGWKKFQKVGELQAEFNRKKQDETDEDDPVVSGPLPPGLELDRLRCAEKKRLRERKQAREQARTEAAVFAAVPLDSVDTVV